MGRKLMISQANMYAKVQISTRQQAQGFYGLKVDEERRSKSAHRN